MNFKTIIGFTISLGVVLIMVHMPLLSSAQHVSTAAVDKALEKGKAAKAVKKLNGLIAKHPKEADLYLYRAKLKIEKSDLDPAMADLNSYCSLQKECIDALFWKGIVRYKQHDYHGAISHFSEYTAKSANTKSDAWLYLGLAHMWLQQYAPGGNSLHRALELDPSNAFAAYNAGICAFRMEQYEMAITYLERATKLAPNDSDMLLALANAYTQKGDYDEGIALLETVDKEDKNYAKAVFNQAVNHYRKEDKVRACELWESSKALGHLNAEDSIKQYCDEK